MPSIILKRVFIHEENGQQIPLSDPDPQEKFTPEFVREFYSNIYPILTTARIEGPVIKNDKLQYTFVSTMGTKG